LNFLLVLEKCPLCFFGRFPNFFFLPTPLILKVAETVLSVTKLPLSFALVFDSGFLLTLLNFPFDLTNGL